MIANSARWAQTALDITVRWRMAAPGLSLLAASNHAATSSGPMRSSGILPNAGSGLLWRFIRTRSRAAPGLSAYGAVSFRAPAGTERNGVEDPAHRAGLANRASVAGWAVTVAYWKCMNSTRSNH